MREILFRGQRADNGEWVIGYYVQKQDPLLVAVTYHYILTQEKDNCGCLMSTVSWYKVIPETIGQYTGLTDKNGKKIFEGDIVSISGDFKGIYTCVWEEYHFDYELENKTMRCCLACVYSDDIKVIGNIHDCKAEDFLK